MKISICYISYLQIWLKMFDPWNCIDVPYWALSSCPFVDNFSGTLSSGEEWWLGRGNFSLLGFWFKLYFGHCLDVKIYFSFKLFEFGVIWTITHFSWCVSFLKKGWCSETLEFCPTTLNRNLVIGKFLSSCNTNVCVVSTLNLWAWDVKWPSCFWSGFWGVTEAA